MPKYFFIWKILFTFAPDQNYNILFINILIVITINIFGNIKKTNTMKTNTHYINYSCLFFILKWRNILQVFVKFTFN